MLKFERKSLSLILLTLILIFSIIIIIIIEHNYDNEVYVDSKRHTKSNNNNRQLLSSDIQITDGQPIKTYNGIVPLTKCPAGIFQIYSIL